MSNEHICNTVTMVPDVDEILQKLSPVVMGGAGFSNQLVANATSVPVVDIVYRALQLGIRAFDTSPYYEPSEQLLGAAFRHPKVTSRYARQDYVLMTKVGRIKENVFNYTPEWIRASVQRSLSRFQTDYLDVVFCHDVEFVSKAEAVVAVGMLFNMARDGIIKYVGISGYDIDVLVAIAEEVRIVYGRPLDVVQNWAQLTLQNTRLEQDGFAAFKRAGVKAVCCSSPLAIGLLRSGGVPVGTLGDWHPAPTELRERAQIAADYVAAQGALLSTLAMRFAVARACLNSEPGFVVTTVSGISTLKELEENLSTIRGVLNITPDEGLSMIWADGSSSGFPKLNRNLLSRDERLYEEIMHIFGPWYGYDFSTKAAAKKTIVQDSRVVDDNNNSRVQRNRL